MLDEHEVDGPSGQTATLTFTSLDGRQLPVWVVDFETYWDDDYTLKKMPITLYVRDERFLAHGAAVRSPDNRRFWVPGRCGMLEEFFASVDWSEACFAAHNTYFDGLIAHEHYGVSAAMYADSMCMSLGEWGPGRSHRLEDVSKRLGRQGKIKGVLENTKGLREFPHELEKKLIEYALVDAEECYQALDMLYMVHGYPDNEMWIIDQTLKAFINPVLRVNPDLCHEEICVESARLKKLIDGLQEFVAKEMPPEFRRIYESSGVEGMLRSTAAFKWMLEQRGVDVPYKPSPSDPEKKIPAFSKTDEGLIRLGEDEACSDLVAARLNVKSSIRMDRAKRLLDYSLEGTRPLPVPLRYCTARTHRWSGFDKINLQNLPSGRDGRGNRLRRALTAPEDEVLVVVDSKQIELRYNAYMSGEHWLVQLIRDGKDPYCALASRMYGVEVVAATDTSPGINSNLRPMGKAMELGLGYGMGSIRFQDSMQSGMLGDRMELTSREAEEAVFFYRQTHPAIVGNWKNMDRILYIMVHGVTPHEEGAYVFYKDKVRMPNGLFMHYRNLRYRKDDKTNSVELGYDFNHAFIRMWGSKFVENLTQSGARTIVADQVTAIMREYRAMEPRVVLLVHDEGVFSIKERYAEEFFTGAKEIMRTAPSWASDMPLDASGGISREYTK